MIRKAVLVNIVGLEFRDVETIANTWAALSANVSLPREGGDVRSKFLFFFWGGVRAVSGPYQGSP